MIIIVNRRHIAQGIRDSGIYGPIAIALRDATGLRASAHRILVLFDDRLCPVHRQPMPDHVVGRFLHYGQTGEMQPFTFEIDYEPTASG